MQETPERGLGHFSIQAEPETGEVSLAPQDADEGPLHQAGEEASLPTTPVVAAWTVQERVQALAQSLAGYWKQLKLESPILLFEGGATQVRVTAEIKPGEEGALTRVPALLADEGWEAAWQDQRLICDRYTDGGAVSNGPLLLPVLRTAQGRRSRTAGETVYVPMGSIHHLGIYGQAAREALHAALAGLLWMQSPSAVGLTILDRGEVSSLYQDAPHWVAPLGGTLETIKRLLHERWIGGETETMRPLIVVISEPEKTERAALVGLLRKLRLAPSAPLHVILVERSPQASAHACYAMLPALITAKADGAWLPAGGQWPKVGAGRLVLGNVLQKEGLALARDESAVAALVRSLGDKPGDLPPVLWESEVLTA